ncbi:Hint domain-containing protein [Sinirhodobacter sp. WL0062]|uniref:Hint domain-containing protein n=1 Tax=Rhodobacter flavimaris TaxID=2907145 RepID=A0ABS8YXA9_9RHOB|nr:Hint domain-containing protein [Sinirhodobacter sp. WL0062]MCE5973386.1 Hint domain-containing protein [Sinirhodobacter sp. WL0062]
MQAHAGWIAAHLPGRGRIVFDQHPLPASVTRGSLMVEFTLIPGEADILPLAHVTGRGVQARFFSLGFTADGQVSVMQRQGMAFHALSLDASDALACGGPMRLTWLWDVAAGESVLALEALADGTLRHRVGGLPLAMPREDLLALAAGTGAARVGPRVDWLAFGDHRHPLGPSGALAPLTQVATPQGWRAVGTLRPGDLVETAHHGAQPVLWSGRVALPALGNLRPVRLCAPHFGSANDLWVAPHQRIALPGAGSAIAEARDLVDGIHAIQPDRPNVLNWHGILLDQPALMIAEGCLVQSLDIGRMCRQPALAALSALADTALPEHSAATRPILTRERALQALGARKAA